jgi:hypothetical protein
MLILPLKLDAGQIDAPLSNYETGRGEGEKRRRGEEEKG